VKRNRGDDDLPQHAQHADSLARVLRRRRGRMKSPARGVDHPHRDQHVDRRDERIRRRSEDTRARLPNPTQAACQQDHDHPYVDRDRARPERWIAEVTAATPDATDTATVRI